MKTKQRVEKYIRGEYLKYKWLVIRQDIGHLCGYVKLWKGHPLEIVIKSGGYDGVDIDCHGGITFGREITKDEEKMKQRGFTAGYWIGWDYAHFGDYMEYAPSFGGKKWTTDEVIKECYEVIDQLTEKFL